MSSFFQLLFRPGRGRTAQSEEVSCRNAEIFRKRGRLACPRDRGRTLIPESVECFPPASYAARVS